MSFPEFVDFLSLYVNPYSGLPGIVIFVLFVSRYRSSNARIVFFILLASLLADVSNNLFIKYVYPNSFIISNSWYLVNYLIVAWLFLKLTPSRAKLINVLTLVFIIGSILSFSFFYSFLESNTFIRTYSSIAFTVLAITTFLEILREGPTDQLKLYPVFWIITGIFLYTSINLLRNLFSNYVIFDMEAKWELVSYLSFFNLVLNITKNLMFFYAFVLIRKGHPDYIHQPNQLSE